MTAGVTAVSADDLGSIRFNYIHEDVAISIYKVASSTGELYGDFAEYSVSLYDEGAANALAAYAERDNIAAEHTINTNSSYIANFENVADGIYLVVGESFTEGNLKYNIMPSLVLIDGNDVDITGKYETVEISSGGGSDTTEIGVMKVWSGSTGESEATVQLLKDGDVYEEVTLSKDNSWRYTWSGLSDKYTWTVAEKDVPANYNVSIEKDGDVYIIINTYSSDGGGGSSEETTENTTEAFAETTTKKSSSGGGGGGLIVNGTTESTTEAETETTTASDKNEKKTETVTEEDVEVTTRQGSGISNLPEDDDSDDSKDDSESVNKNTNPDSDSNVIDKPITPGEAGEPNQKEPNAQSENNADEPNQTPGEMLPQTGQLWYPVPILAFAGILCIIFGLRERYLESLYEKNSIE